MIRLPWFAAVTAAVLLALAGPAAGASKATIAAIGDPVPGGGVFAGPGFRGWPSAAGSGWIAFRGEITGGRTSETIVVARRTPPFSQAEVASIGDPAPSGGIFAKCTGKLKQFAGRPVVNAQGEVAFVALIEPPTETGDAPETGPVPAGIFAVRDGELVPVACSGQSTPGGILDLVAMVGLSGEGDDGVADRAPALNDAGDVAFLTGYVTEQGSPAGGAVVVAPRAGGFTEHARIDGAFDGGKFLILGAPALNNGGLVAFHGLASTTDPTDDDGLIDGIFAADTTGLRVLARDGIAPMPVDQPVHEFQDTVALNDRGDVAFIAGPLVHVADDGELTESPGVLVWRAGVVTLVAYPGQKIGPDRVTGLALGPLAGSTLAGPSLAPDGSVVFFVSLNGGSSEAIVRSNGQAVLPLAYTGGTGADESPAGGVYAGAESAPAADGVGGVVFLARVAGGSSSQVIVYHAADGSEAPIVLGEAGPEQNQGFFGGRPFSSPQLNDRGDVVFRAFVAQGPTSVGIFRARDGELTAVVRAADAAPLAGGPPFVDVLGEPSLNQRGDVAFAAQVAGRGRGIFVADAAGVRKVALRDDPAPGEPDSTFAAIGTNPRINEAGAVAFRATTTHPDPILGLSVKREGIFVHDGTAIRLMVYAEEPSPAGLPFLKLRDPLITDAASVIFRAPLGVSEEQTSGIFVADASGTAALAVEQQPLGGGVVLTGFSGSPAVTASGEVAFVATRARPIDEGGLPLNVLGPSILRRVADALELVVARDMRGPAGGTFHGIGQPAINARGHVVFRGSFNPLTGGTSGFYLHRAGSLVPYLLRGEVSPLGGRFSALDQQPSLNATDELAFSGDVSSGKARSGIFVASPTTLRPRRLRLRLSDGRGRDRVALRLALALGRVSDGVRPANEPVIVSLSDTGGVLWSVTVPAKRLEGGDRRFKLVPARASELARSLRAVQLTVGKNQTVRLSALSARVDLTERGARTLEPPFTVALEVGDDAGTALVACQPGRRGARCR